MCLVRYLIPVVETEKQAGSPVVLRQDGMIFCQYFPTLMVIHCLYPVYMITLMTISTGEFKIFKKKYEEKYCFHFDIN